jgi:hypothetical protein
MSHQPPQTDSDPMLTFTLLVVGGRFPLDEVAMFGARSCGQMVVRPVESGHCIDIWGHVGGVRHYDVGQEAEAVDDFRRLIGCEGEGA